MPSFSLIGLLTPLFAFVMVMRAFALFRRGKQTWREFALWVMVWGGIAVIALWPHLLDVLPEFVGIKSGVNLLVFFGFIVLFYGFFRLFSKVEDLEQKLVELNRQQALKEVSQKKKDS